MSGYVRSSVGGIFPAIYFDATRTRFIAWVEGSPEGVLAASPGSVVYNSLGGAGTTQYNKRTGTGATGWYAVA